MLCPSCSAELPLAPPGALLRCPTRCGWVGAAPTVDELPEPPPDPYAAARAAAAAFLASATPETLQALAEAVSTVKPSP